MYEFAKEMYFVVKAPGNKSITDRTLIKLLESPAIMASGISTMFLPEYPNELCNRIKILLQEKQAGSNSDMIDEEVIALSEKLLEYKCKPKK